MNNLFNNANTNQQREVAPLFGSNSNANPLNTGSSNPQQNQDNGNNSNPSNVSNPNPQNNQSQQPDVNTVI